MNFQKYPEQKAIVDTDGKPDEFDGPHYGGHRLVGESIRDEYMPIILAAPDMLEALKNIENDDQHMPATAWKMIQDAIAKAEGRK